MTATFQDREITVLEITEHETVFFTFVDSPEDGEQEAPLGSVSLG